jgi:HAD superfamily hydrolase (TIGR01509 family)
MTTTETTNNTKYDTLTLLTAGDFKAFLYDCDGTLADSMGPHKKTYVRVAADEGVMIDDSIIDELAGWPIVDVINEINNRYKTTFDAEIFARKKDRLFFDEYVEQVQPIDFVVNHLKAHVDKLKIGVVSGGDREAVEKTLKVIGIFDLVEVIVCARETPRGKPFPDPFLAAAEKLGVDPKDCLVFEDGDPGVKAAEAAGMKWVRIDKV